MPTEVEGALPDGAWIVGGAVRDEILGRDVVDIDAVVSGDPEAVASGVRKAVGNSAMFSLNDAFGAWRVVDHDHRWQVDVSPLAGTTISEDLAHRDLTVNAIAREVGSQELIDPFDGRRDLDAKVLRAVGSTSFTDDPLRVLRLVRIAGELGFEVEPATLELARDASPQLPAVSGERQFMEFGRIIGGGESLAGIRLMDDLGALEAVLPELTQLRGIGQSSYHHLDCFEHTLMVLEQSLMLEDSPDLLGESGLEVAALLNGDIGDGLRRWDAVRLGALLHDIAKSTTRVEYSGGRIGFPDHQIVGMAVTAEILARLRTSTRLSSAVQAMVRHHMDAGFMTHHEPVSARDIEGYLVSTEPVSVDVTVLSAADRLATRGRRSDEAIPRHMGLCEKLLRAAVEREKKGTDPALIRGDDLASALGIEQGPQVGVLLAELAAAQYAGEICTEEEAVAHAQRFLASQ
ncbi:MAG: HD domain-containing protein [Solirubrobacterales bacterium]|nr:HD domain-containing protein [Solirubrobacterales bacterium]